MIIIIIGLISKSEAVKRTAYLIFIIGVLTSIVAMTSGEGAEDFVENIKGVSENYIETHEEAAEVFSILTYVLGGLSLIGLWISFKQKSFSDIMSAVTLAFSLGVLFFGAETGTPGGEIRHTEIRSDNNISIPESNYFKENQDD